MSQQVISYADLSIINNALRNISTDMQGVHSELGNLNIKQAHLDSELQKLAYAFADYVKADSLHKALQLAETRVGNLRQELEQKYGFYAEVRRMATGMLQGVDTGVVSDDTLRTATEEVMIKAAGYWLAPALIVLACWLRNDKPTAAKALQEALRRDDYKTTLFFMLVMRRLGRNDASLQWLERYFMHQNPHQLDREFIVVMEAVATGIFPPAARLLLMTNVKSWLEQLTQSDTFINQQKAQWVKFFEAFVPARDAGYPLLVQFATNWNALGKSLQYACAHGLLTAHFTDIIKSSADFSKSLKVQLDEILTLLVTNFDDEELPLQEQVRLNQLIVQMDGDKQAAQERMDTEKHIFSSQVNFLQLLTNACFNPQLAGATKVTQALAVSISQPWIVEAHDTFTAQTRSAMPKTVELAIDGFTTATTDGKNETELLQQQDAFYRSVLNNELSSLPFPIAKVVIGALVCVIGLWAFKLAALLGIASLAIGAVLIWNALKTWNNAKSTIVQRVEERKRKAREVLRGCIAETVDYRSEWATEDAKAEALRQLLLSITPADFSSVSKEAARSFV